MRKYILVIVILLILFSSVFIENRNAQKLQPPSQGVYHSAYPDFNDSEDNVTPERISEFENKVNKSIVWAPFSDNWGISNITFPKRSVKILDEQNIIPYIRMMPISKIECSNEAKEADPVYNLQKIIKVLMMKN
ncbi:hypothetical protein [Methanobacterium sp. ACI-7]|uniref:hypothetical protein n=1 Tax=unclassified Methanobacterium TaxID=2627676 RepID=UPI0039C0D23E